MKLLAIALLVCLSGCAGKRLVKTDDIRPVSTPPVVAVDPEPNMTLAVLDQPGEFEPFTVTVYFDLNSAEIRPDAANMLESLKDRLETDAKDRSVMIYGACCPLGSESHNNTLALHRATVVRDALGRGIAESWGETHFLSTNPDEYHLNRRAEVHVK